MLSNAGRWPFARGFAVRRCRVAGERLVVEPEQQRGQGNQSHRVRPVIRGENIADRADVAVEKARRGEDFGWKWRKPGQVEIAAQRRRLGRDRAVDIERP